MTPEAGTEPQAATLEGQDLDVYQMMMDGAEGKEPAATPAAEPAAAEGTEPAAITPEGGATEPAAVEPAAATPQPLDEVDKYIFEQSGGAFKDFNDLKTNGNVFEIFGDHPAMSTELEKLRSTVAKHENPFTNDFVEKLNTHISLGGDAAQFMQIQTMDLDAMSPKDALYHQIKIDHPQLSHDQIEGKLTRDYHIGNEDETLVSEGETDMLIDAKSAKEKLAGMKGDMAPPFMSEEDQIAAEAVEATELKQSWESPIQTISENLPELKFALNEGGDPFIFEFPEGHQKVMAEQLQSVIESNGLPATQDGFNAAVAIAKNLAIIEYIPQIIQKAAEQARSMEDDEWHKATHNPSAAATPAGAPAKQAVSRDDELFNFFEEGESGTN